GNPPERIVGASFVSVVHPDDRAAWREELSRMQDAGWREHGTELRLVDADGKAHWTRLTFAQVTSIQGEPEAIAFVCLDFTEEKEMETRLRQAQKLESVGQLTGGIAHDFNN